MLLPSALGFSPHPPVSVYGTGTIRTIAAFLDAWLTYFPTLDFGPHHAFGLPLRFFLQDSYLACTRLSIPRLCSPHVSPQFCLTDSTGISTCCPSATISRPRLRPRLTQGRSALPWKPWIFGREDSHLSLATHSGILSSMTLHSSFRYCFVASANAPLPIPCRHSSCFGVVFQPRTFSAQDLSTSELLRTL